MKKIKRIFSLALIVMLVLALAPVATQANNPVQDARNSIVRVVNIAGGQMGTGFAIGKVGEPIEYIITNGHVVWVLDDDGDIIGAPDEVYIVSDNLNAGTELTAKIIQWWQTPDLAILRLSTPTTMRVAMPLLSARELEVTDEVYALGFPGAADKMSDYGDSLPSSPEDVTVTRGMISNNDVLVDGTDYLQTDATIHKGNSGGPLITPEGYVVGINTLNAITPKQDSDGTWYYETVSGVNYSLYIDYAMDYLDTIGIPYDRATLSSQTPDPLGGEAGGAPVTAEPAPVPVPTPAPAKSFLDTVPVWAWIVLGIVIIGAIVAIVLVASKKKPEPQPVQQPIQQPVAQQPVQPVQPTQPVQQPRQGPQLNCICGTLAGRTYPLSSQLTLGRDPQRCQIVYPAKTPGVSGEHLRIHNDGDGAFTLTDLGSSYGTFFANGEKLMPNTPYKVHTGDVFYLASKDNGFKIM